MNLATLNKINIKPKYIFLFTFLVFSAIHLLIVLVNHYQFKTFAFDYGVYNFAFYDYAHFRVSPCPIYLVWYDSTFLQDHFSLTLILLSPLYWLFHDLFGTYTLLIIQWGFICTGGYYTFKYILLKSKHYYISVSALIFYFTIYGRFSSYYNDCNLAIIGAAVLPLFLYFFETRKVFITVVCYLFILVTREDFSLTLAFLTLFLFISNRRNKKQMLFSGVLFLVSCAFFIVVFKFIIPLLEDENKKFTLFNYSLLGSNPAEALRFVFKHPLETFKYLFINHTSNPSNDDVKATFYLVYGLSGGFLLLLRPAYCIVLIPLIAKKMFNDDPARWGHQTYYSIEIVSLLPIFVFSIFSEFKKQKTKNISALVLVLLTLTVTSHLVNKANPVLYGNAKFNFLSKNFYTSDYSAVKIRSLISEIPDEAAVCASSRIVSHLAFRDKIYYFPKLDSADYIIAAKHGDTFPASEEDYALKIEECKKSKEWIILYEEENLIFLKRVKV